MKKTFLMVFVLFAAIGSGFSAPLASNEGYVILNNLPLWVEKSGGVLEFKESLVIGDKVGITGKVYKFKQDGKERDYYWAKAPSGAEGYVRVSYIATKAGLAVVKAEKAIVYSEARDVKMTAKVISEMTIVAVLQDGSTPEYARVVGYDAAQDIYYTDPVFVSRADLSFADVDLNALILFASAKGTKDKAIRANFLRLIEAKYSSSLFFQDIKAVLAPESVKPSSAAGGSYTVNDDNVNVRATPDEVGGQVVGKLGKGAVVTVVEATNQSYTIGALKGPWYKIAEPSGWVYGPFLTPSN